MRTAIAAALLLAVPAATAAQDAAEPLTPASVVAASKPEEWVAIDPADHRVQVARPCRIDDRFEQPAADPAPARRPGHIHRVLDGARIGRPVAKAAEGGEALRLALGLGDEQRPAAAALGLEP